MRCRITGADRVAMRGGKEFEEFNAAERRI
jgi:hypothetical protein